jgi:hypothetical protein
MNLLALTARGPVPAALIVAAMLALDGCAPPASGDQAAASATDLPPFTAAEAALFDDTIALVVFGSDLDQSDPAKDPKLAERVARADVVVPVKISTVTSDSGGEVGGYLLTVVPTGAALHGSSDSQPITLEVSSRSPAYPFVKSADATLVGRPLILILRRYAVDGAVVPHFRMEPDTDEVRKAIAEASALEELGR